MNSEFVQSLRTRLVKLDADYARHRAALLSAIACETGEEHADKGNVSHGHGTILPPPPNPDAHRYRNQKDMVKAAILAFVLTEKTKDGSFTKTDVLETLKTINFPYSNYLATNLASFLWRLHKHDGYITVKEQGQGHRPSVYVLAKKEPTPEGAAP